MPSIDPRNYFRYNSPVVAQQTYRLVATRLLLHVGMMSSYFIGIMGSLTYAMGQGVLANALAVAALNLFQMLGGIKGGELLDRKGPHSYVRLCVGMIVTCGLAYQVLGTSVLGIYIGAASLGFVFGFSDVVARAFPAYISGDVDELKRINSALALASNISIVVGPLIGGFIVLAASTQAVFLFMAACAALSLIPAWGIEALRTPLREEGEARRAKLSDKRGSVWMGFSEIFGSSVLSLIFWSTLLSFMSFGAFDPLESLYYRDVLKVGAEWMGWLSAIAGVGGVVGALLAGAFPARFINLRTLMLLLTASGIGCFIYVCSPYVAVACVGQFALGIAFSAFGPVKDTLIQAHTPLDRIGRVNAAMGVGYNASGAFPLLLAPFLADWFGVQGTLMGIGVLVAVLPLSFMMFRREEINALVEDERRFTSEHVDD